MPKIPLFFLWLF